MENPFMKGMENATVPGAYTEVTKEVKMRNIATSLLLAGFSGSVYYYSINRMKTDVSDSSQPFDWYLT